MTGWPQMASKDTRHNITEHRPLQANEIINVVACFNDFLYGAYVHTGDLVSKIF
jgi:hypothetical protein